MRIKTFFDYDDYEDYNANNGEYLDIYVEDCVKDITCWECVGDSAFSAVYAQASCPAGTSLDKPKCVVETEEEVTVIIEETKDTVETTTTPDITGDAIAAPVTYVPSSDKMDMLYVGLLVLGYIVVLFIGVGMVGHIWKKK